MENENNIKIKTGEKHFDISKSGAVDLRARNMEKERQYDNKEEISEERNIEKKAASENVFKSFLKKRTLRQAQGDNKQVQGDSNVMVSLSNHKVSKVFDKAIAALLYFLVFALPIFILPFSVEIYEFNKTLLLFFISSLAFLLWIAKMILIDKRLTFIRTPLDMPIIIFISVILISTVFSVDKVSSILGFYGRFSDSLMVYFSLAMFYFIVVNFIGKIHSDEEIPAAPFAKEEAVINNFIKAFLASSFLVMIASLIYFIGFKFIPWEEAQFRAFNLAGGSLNVLAMYLVAVILIAIGYRQSKDAINRAFTNALIVISLILLILIDFVLAWIILAVSLITVLALGTIAKAGIRRSFVSTGLIFIISLAFIASSLSFINKKIQPDLQLNSEEIFTESLISKSIKNRLVNSDNGGQVAGKDVFTREVILEKKTIVSIAIEGAKKDLFAGVIGSGPGTYLYNFSKFKPAEFNSNAFWSIRFDKAGSEIVEKISTIGIVGTLSYLLIIVLVMGMFLKDIFRRRPAQGGSSSSVYIFAAWFALLLFQFLYLEATTTKFIFWLFTAVLAAVLRQAQDDKDVMVSPSNHFVLNLKKNKTSLSVSLIALLIISASFVASYYYQARFYKAEMAYKNSVAKQNLDQSASDLENVIKLNPYRGEYEVYLSNVSLGKLAAVLQGQKEDAVSEEDMQKIGLEAKNAIDYIKRAVELGPNNVSFQQKFGSTYAILSRDLNIEKADEWAIKGYQRAIELEPTNPVLHTELGKIYILQSYKLEADDKVDQAIKEFEKAIELKNDYADAILELGLAYEAKGDYEKAIEAVDSLKNAGNISVDVAFQLGRIYYNSGKVNEAKNIFLEIIKVEPNNSNARYSLGLIYEKEENNQAALAEFEIVLSLNPENQEVKERVEKLKKLVEKENKNPEPVSVIEDEDLEDEIEE